MSASGGTKAVIAALLANLGIALSKFVAFFITGSASMLAEAIHSVADSGNQGLLLLGGRQARQAADREHPFGYGRARYFWAFVVAVVLFTLGSLFALFEGYEKLRHPHELEQPFVAVGVLLVGILAESFSFRTAIVEAGHVRRDEGWAAFIRHSRSPELPVILLEDFGALVGLLLALVGVSMSIVTGDSVFDALGTMSIGVLLGIIAVVLAIEMRSLLIGESATAADVEKIRTALVGGPEVDHLIDLKTLHLGPDELLVVAKVQMPEELTFSEVAAAINRAETRVRAAVPSARVIYIEPDCYDADYRSPVPPTGSGAAH
jgi:cation diffusion facilitator family transporter